MSGSGNGPQTDSPSYRLAALDADFLLGDSMRGVRFQLEYAKAEEALRTRGIRSTIVVFGSARITKGAEGRKGYWYEQARAFGRLASQRGGALLADAGPLDNVIATGGGIVTRPENWVELRRLGLTCYLDASFETLCERLEVSKKKRPLLESDDWQKRLSDLIAVRKPLYEQADFSVEVNHNDLGLTAEAVQQAFEERTTE